MTQENCNSSTKKDCYLTELGWWIDYSKKIFKRGVFVPDSISDGYLNNFSNNIGIFKTTYTYESENQDVSLLYGDYYIDFDSSEYDKVKDDVLGALAYFKIVFDIDYSDMQIYYSGNKGIHLIIPKEVLGVVPHKELNLIFKSITVKCSQYTKNSTIDMQIYDNKRLFRVVNSQNEKTLLYKIPLTYDEVKSLTEIEVKTLAKSKRTLSHGNYNNSNNRAIDMYKWFIGKYNDILEVKLRENMPSNSNKNLKYKPPCIDYILNNGANSGNRNNTLAILASYYNSSGSDINIALAELTEWNSRLITPLDKRELYATIYSMYRGNKNFGCNTISAYYECTNECRFYKGDNNGASGTNRTTSGGKPTTRFSFSD